MHSLIFADLDDTLFQTLRKCPDRSLALAPRAYLGDGSVISYSTPKQDLLWQWLEKGGIVIPVTARSYGAFTRVNLPFSQEAIINHGAVILDKAGQVHPGWQQHMEEVLPFYQQDFCNLWELLTEVVKAQPEFKLRLADDWGTCWYGFVKHAQADEMALQELLQTIIVTHPAVIAGRLYWHFNSNNLAILPAVVNKKHAVKFLLDVYREQYGMILTVGIGDSRTDAQFMSLCDYAIVPANTQLGEILRGL